jgi:transposase
MPMPRRKGELTPRQVAKETGTHKNTVYNWARAALEGRPSPLKGHTRRDATGHIFIRAIAVRGDVDYF